MIDWGYLALLDKHNIRIIGIEFDYDFQCTKWAE